MKRYLYVTFLMFFVKSARTACPENCTCVNADIVSCIGLNGADIVSRTLLLLNRDLEQLSLINCSIVEIQKTWFSLFKKLKIL